MDKSDGKMVCEKSYQLKLEFYNIDRKMKNVIRPIFISIIMHLNFMHFCQIISFKSALESFTSVNGHLTTAFRRLANLIRKRDHIVMQ